MSELPADWALVSFSEVAELVRGVSYKKNESDINPREGLIPILRANNIQNGNLVLHDLVYVPTEKVKEKQLIKQGDIIVAMSSGSKKLVGKSGVCDKRITASFGTFCGLIRAKSNCYPRYLGWFTQSKYYTDTISNLSKGVNINNLKPAHFEELQIPLPTLAEQKRIADKLDSVLAKVEAAQARLDKIPAILKLFRQSVLAAATSGELTKEWRGDEKYRDETLNWPISKIPESWELKFLEEVAESRLGKMLDKSKNSGIATKYLGNINLRWHHIDLFELKEILVSQKEINELNIRDGDLLLCEGGEPGRGAVWKGGDNNLVFQKAIHRVRCTDCISPEFLLYSIEDDFFSNRLSLLYTGTTIKHLTGKALKKYPVRIPPIAEQIEIVRRVNRLLEASSKIEEQYLAAKLRVNQLTQSILKKAFEGELLTSEVENEFLQELSDVEAVEC